MHTSSARAILARAGKFVGDDVRSLYDRTGPGPDLTPRPLRAHQGTFANGLMHVATNLIAGARARQNYDAKVEQQRGRDQYMQARIAEINERIHPTTEPIEIGGQVVNVPLNQAARVHENLAKQAAGSGAGRVLTPGEIATHNQMFPKYALDPNSPHTQGEIAEAHVAAAREAMQGHWNAVLQARREATHATGKFLNTQLGESHRAETAAGNAEIERNKANVQTFMDKRGEYGPKGKSVRGFLSEKGAFTPEKQYVAARTSAIRDSLSGIFQPGRTALIRDTLGPRAVSEVYPGAEDDGSKEYLDTVGKLTGPTPADTTGGK